MWVCMNNAFVSVVEDAYDDTMVFVRARVRDHLVKFMGTAGPQFDIVETSNRDYMFRIRVTKSYAASRVAEHMMNIDYTNFKSSVADMDLRQAYHMVWKDMFVGVDSRVDKMTMMYKKHK